MKWMFRALSLLLRLLGWTKGAPSAEQQLGAAETAARAEEQARVETSAALDARRDADARRLRDEGAGPVTVDPAAGVNRDDGFRRD